MIIPGIFAQRRTTTPPAPEFPDISSLMFRFTAKDLLLTDGSQVASWADSAGVMPALAQATAAKRPLYRAAGINGRPAVEFDGTDDRMTVAFGVTKAQPNTFFVVLRVPAGAAVLGDAYPWIDGNTSAARHWFGVDGLVTGDPAAMWAGSSFVDSVRSIGEDAYVFRVEYNGAASELLNLNTRVAAGNPGAHSLSGLSVGSRWDNARFTNVLISEIVGFDGILDASEVEQVEDYLSYEYGIYKNPLRFIGSSYAGSSKWAYGATSSVNGAVYCAPFESQYVLKIDPHTGETATIGPALGSGTDKWIGMVEAADGRIFGVPGRDGRLLVVDPADDSVTTYPFSTSVANSRYYGGVLANNGKIYCPPIFARDVLVIDPATNTAVTIGSNLGQGSTSNGRWGWFTKGGDGKLYGAPRDEPGILVVDPSDDSISTITTGVPDGGRKYTQGEYVSATDEIWFVPRAATTLMVLKVLTGVVRTVGTLPSGTDKWNGVATIRGKMCMFPRYNANVLVIDPITDELSYQDTLIDGDNKWVGAARTLTGDGAILVPFSISEAAKFEPHGPAFA